MPSCLPQSNELSCEPPFNDKKYHDGDLDMSNEMDGRTSLIDEQKRATQETIMMQDLGSCIRDWITRSDFSRLPNVSLRQLQRDRAVEDPGSEANKAYVENKKKINGWNNLHVELKNDGGAEELDTMMDGQSHRAKLREIVVNTGGQRYDPHSSDDPPRHSSGSRATRGGTASRGGRGGGMVGTRGRGASTSHGRSPITLGSVNNRPLDPAIDPKDPRSKYRSRRGGAQSSKGSQQANRSSASVNSASRRGLGRDGKAQDVRARIVGTTVQVAAASARPPQARQLEPSSKRTPAASAVNHNPRTPIEVKPAPPARFLPVLQGSDGILDPKRFLAVLAATTDRERFNKMVPSQPKLVPASRAAKLVAKPSERVEKTFNELVQSTPKPALPPKAAKMVANLNLLKKGSQKIMKEPEARKLAPEKQVPEGKADEVNPMVPTTAKNPEPEGPEPEGLMLEEVTPANITRPKPKVERLKVKIPNVVKPTRGEEEQCLEERKEIRQVPTHEFVFPQPFSKLDKSFGEPDAWTDGVLTPQTPNFSASTENSPAIGFAKVMGEGNASAVARASSATLRTATAVVSLGISTQSSSAPEPRANIETDLLMLESEEAVGHGGTYVSGAVADLMDLDFNDTSQESLTPCLPGPLQGLKPESSASKEHPRCVKIDGIRYFREDQLARAILPQEATSNTATIHAVSANPATTDRVVTESGYTIGVRHLGLHDGNLLGDRNLARRPEESLTPRDLDSIWADRPAGVTGRRIMRTGSPVRVDHQQKLEALIQRNPSLDPKLSAIGQRNLLGRSHLISQDTPAISARGPPQAEEHDMTRPVQHPQGASMPRAANPWNTSHSIASTEPRPSDLAESNWGEANARDVTHLSQSRADGSSVARTMARSFKTTTSGLSGDSVFSRDEALRSIRNDFHSYTSENAGLSSVRSIRGIAEQQKLSEKISAARENSPVQETEAEQMVRMMRSQGSAGLARLPIAHPANEPREGRSSVSSAGHSRGSSRSEGTTAKSATSLNTSKWAEEGTAMSVPAIRPSAKPAKISSRVPSATASNTQFMRQEGKTRTTIVRTNAGPGFALLMAEAAAAAASSDSPSTDTNNRATSKAPDIESESGAVSHTTTEQPLGTRNALANGTITSEPRVRIINLPRPLCQNAGPAKVQRGRGNFQNGNSNHNGSDSDESEL